jgi:hypothetical protein
MHYLVSPPLPTITATRAYLGPFCFTMPACPPIPAGFPSAPRYRKWLRAPIFFISGFILSNAGRTHSRPRSARDSPNALGFTMPASSPSPPSPVRPPGPRSARRRNYRGFVCDSFFCRRPKSKRTHPRQNPIGPVFASLPPAPAMLAYATPAPPSTLEIPSLNGIEFGKNNFPSPDLPLRPFILASCNAHPSRSPGASPPAKVKPPPQSQAWASPHARRVIEIRGRLPICFFPPRRGTTPPGWRPRRGRAGHCPSALDKLSRLPKALGVRRAGPARPRRTCHGPTRPRRGARDPLPRHAPRQPSP